MRDASVERLAKLISERDDDSQDENKTHRPELHLSLAEGWFSLFLVAVIIYSTIVCVQAANWVEHLDRLTFTTALGLLCGLLAAKQQRFPRWLLHVFILCFGLLLAFWQTSSAFFSGDNHLFLDAIQRWLGVINSGGSTDDDSIFLFFIIALSFLLAYTSTWLVYRTRSPWLMIVANAIVILINLNNSQDGNVIFLVVFLMAALLLLLRFNLYESLTRWKRQGLRYADDISWDFMQAGAFLSIGILIFSWLLPGSYLDPLVSQIWNAKGSPLVAIENTWNRVIAVDNSALPANHGSFQNNLTLGGNPHLTNEVVMQLQADDESQYLGSLTYDTYTGHAWTNEGAIDDTLKVPSNFSYASGALLTHPVKQKVSIVNSPQEPYPFVFGASEISQVNLPTKWLNSATTGSVIAWVAQDSRLANGNTTYTVISNVSSADIETLRTVPTPKNAPAYPASNQYNGADLPVPSGAYNPVVLQTNVALPKGLDPRIAKLAQRITANSPTMYDKVVALENYLRQNYTYDLNVQPPTGSDGVSWFLFNSKKGFCNYFASSMAVLARSVGIPARVEVGYTNGTIDAKNHQRIIRGVDAHAWTQVYFAGYGWINFEPSATFSTFNRPQPNQYNASSASAPADLTGSVGNSAATKLRGKDPESSFDSGTTTTTTAPQWRQELNLILGTLILLLIFAAIAFAIWWRRLFQGYGLSSQIFGRMSLLAGWAGVRMHTSQTPYEYVKGLSVIAPGEEATLERLSDIYVRDRWADPASPEHPALSGEIQTLPAIWQKMQPRFFFYVLRHPNFLRWLPQRLLQSLRLRRRRWKLKKQMQAQELL